MLLNGTVFDFAAAEKTAPGGELLLVPLVSRPRPALEQLAAVDRLCDSAVSALVAADALRDEVGQTLHTLGAARQRVVVVGLGAGEKLTAAELRAAAGAAARWVIAAKRDRAALWIDGLLSCGVAGAVGHFAAGMALAGFRFEEYRKSSENGPAAVRMALRAGTPSAATRALGEVRDALVVAEAVNYARRIAHLPPNVLHPAALADHARKLARPGRLKCTVLQSEKLRQMGMGGLLAVGTGAKHAPCLIQLEYRGAPRSRSTVALVGKAVTFDTGGYSIKPAENMDAMKFDKCGGMAVLGVLKAAADLRLKCNVVGLIAAAENAISAEAYRPGDILTMYSGKTVEITNTDAEGRLILADALWYAQEKFAPTSLINLATLTGGVRIALGTAAAGLMSNNDDLSAELGECGRQTHERLWRLPLWDDYKPLLKSSEADIKNSSGKRDAHAIAGGMFLKEFIKPDTCWAHLDIAAVATTDDVRGPYGKGATGFGIQLLIEFLRRRSV